MYPDCLPVTCLFVSEKANKIKKNLDIKMQRCLFSLFRSQLILYTSMRKVICSANTFHIYLKDMNVCHFVAKLNNATFEL